MRILICIWLIEIILYHIYKVCDTYDNYKRIFCAILIVDNWYYCIVDNIPTDAASVIWKEKLIAIESDHVDFLFLKSFHPHQFFIGLWGCYCRCHYYFFLSKVQYYENQSIQILSRNFHYSPSPFVMHYMYIKWSI